jgi:DNA primase
MGLEGKDNVREYYRRITEADIGAVVRELLGAHVLHESDSPLQRDCRNHKSPDIPQTYLKKLLFMRYLFCNK